MLGCCRFVKDPHVPFFKILSIRTDRKLMESFIFLKKNIVCTNQGPGNCYKSTSDLNLIKL